LRCFTVPWIAGWQFGTRFANKHIRCLRQSFHWEISRYCNLAFPSFSKARTTCATVRLCSCTCAGWKNLLTRLFRSALFVCRADVAHVRFALNIQSTNQVLRELKGFASLVVRET